GRTCLAKDPEERWQSAHDIKSELLWIAQAGSQAGAAAPVPARRRSRERVAWILATLLGLGFAATLPLAVFRGRRASAQSRTLKLSVLPPEKGSFVPVMIALSPVVTRLPFGAAGA